MKTLWTTNLVRPRPSALFRTIRRKYAKGTRVEARLSWKGERKKP
jgi:hypothetical protein